jgi:hypothetical protein
MDRATLSALAAFPDQLEAHFAAVPREFIHWKPSSREGIPSEPFTALEHLCHLRDIEIDGYRVRLRRTLDEELPRLESIDGAELARSRHYGGADAARVSSSFRAARAETLRLLMTLDSAQLSRTALFAEHGVVTLRALVHLLCSHDQQHLSGLQWLLGRLNSPHDAHG